MRQHTHTTVEDVDTARLRPALRNRTRQTSLNTRVPSAHTNAGVWPADPVTPGHPGGTRDYPTYPPDIFETAPRAFLDAAAKAWGGHETETS